MPLSKRLFDILLASMLSLVFAPVMAVILIWLASAQGRPFFFVSERMKTPQRSFGLIKLRTMSNDAAPSGATGGHKSDYITPPGRFLRRTRLDELPQLWNVLKGDISFVGPRPPLRQYVESAPSLYQAVLRSRPGITGLASLTYHAHEDWLLSRCSDQVEVDRIYQKNCVPRKAKLDLIYQKHAGFCFDLMLLFRTMAVFIRR